MKKIIISIITITFALVVLSSCGNSFNESLVGHEVSISWEEVNVRENHTTSSDIIVTLERGDTVILTGNSYSYSGGNGRATEDWTEIKLSGGTIGWVVTRSINW